MYYIYWPSKGEKIKGGENRNKCHEKGTRRSPGPCNLQYKQEGVGPRPHLAVK